MTKEPIILLGSHRSGTTWLGDVFSQHPGLAGRITPGEHAPQPATTGSRHVS